MVHPEKLVSLVEREKRLKKHVVAENPHIKIIGDYSNLRTLSKAHVAIESQGLVFLTLVDDIFIAQVAKKIYDADGNGATTKNVHFSVDAKNKSMGWEEENSFQEQLFRIRIHLQYLLSTESERTIARISQGLKGMIILFFEMSSDRKVYGFVSQKFAPSNQLQFREQFIDLCSKRGELINVHSTTVFERKSRVIELFKFNAQQNSDIDVSCGLTYGKNNGYGSYYVFWLREIRETRSWLFPLISHHKYNWKNNPLVTQNEAGSLDAFVQYIIEEGVRIQKINETMARKMKGEQLDPDRMMEFFERVLDKAKVAKASKDRCTGYYKEKYLATKNSLRNSTWAIGESIAFVGTHEKAVPETMKIVLRKLVSMLFELGFEEFEKQFGKDFFNFTMKVPT
jgi:hypothetical protein